MDALSVVIVDDTPDLRDLLRIALTRGGFDVVGEAGDGAAGIEVVRAHRPDVVLLDLAMPVMDGLEALPTIRELCPAAKIVVLSGFGAPQMSGRAVAAGADGYVQKGAPLTTILDYVSELTSGGRRPAPPRTVAAAPPPRAEPSDAEAVEMAPYGVLEVVDEPLFRIVRTNPVAARLLGTGSGATGTPLADVAPDLASLVSFHRLDADASFETQVENGRVRAGLRRTATSVLVYLDSNNEDVGMLRRAIATTAHEVRGPVAVLCGVAETLAWDSELMSIDQTRRLMDSVARQARILDRITADLLTAAQIQRGTLRIDHQVVDPRALVLGTVEGRWDVDLVVEDPRSVRADPLRLEQMLTNLISNAHKYGAAPYVVRVRPDPEQPEMVAIDVVDHGAGVPAEFGEHLFREFARAHGAVATGTGLGLYVVRTLAQAQDGDVAYTPGPDGGSVFTVTLPAHDA